MIQLLVRKISVYVEPSETMASVLFVIYANVPVSFATWISCTIARSYAARSGSLPEKIAGFRFVVEQRVELGLSKRFLFERRSKISSETPATYCCFDMLAADDVPANAALTIAIPKNGAIGSTSGCAGDND
jgi:hypothetical protein